MYHVLQVIVFVSQVKNVGSCSVCAFQENVDPALTAGDENQPTGEQQVQRRELTVEDEHEIWRDITVTQYEHTLN